MLKWISTTYTCLKSLALIYLELRSWFYSSLRHLLTSSMINTDNKKLCLFCYFHDKISLKTNTTTRNIIAYITLQFSLPYGPNWININLLYNLALKQKYNRIQPLQRKPERGEEFACRGGYPHVTMYILGCFIIRFIRWGWRVPPSNIYYTVICPAGKCRFLA